MSDLDLNNDGLSAAEAVDGGSSDAETTDLDLKSVRDNIIDMSKVASTWKVSEEQSKYMASVIKGVDSLLMKLGSLLSIVESHLTNADAGPEVAISVDTDGINIDYGNLVADFQELRDMLNTMTTEKKRRLTPTNSQDLDLRLRPRAATRKACQKGIGCLDFVCPPAC